MEQNLDLTVGNKYILDKEFRNSSTIELVEVYGKLFCRVKNPETNYEWDTMCNRLSEII